MVSSFLKNSAACAAHSVCLGFNNVFCKHVIGVCLINFRFFGPSWYSAEFTGASFG